MRKSAAFLLCAAAFALASVPANATVGIGCTGMTTDAGVDILFGAGPVPNFLEVTVVAAGQKISTRAQDGFTEANIAQAYDDGEMVRVDLMDVQAERLLAAIRFIRADDKAGPLQIGYVQLPDTAPIAITCEGP